MGDAQACFDTLYEGLKEDRDTDTANPTQILMALCYWYWMTADLARLTLIAERLLVVGQSRDLPAALGWGHYFRGCARYVCDDLSGAASDFEAVADRRVMSSAASYPQSVFGLAMTHMARGDFERPLELADSMVSYALESTNTDLLAEAEIFQGLVALVAGRPLDAARWIAPYSQGVPLRPMHLFHIANLSVARILVTLPLPEHRAAAAELLDRLLAFVEATRNTRFRIDVLALRALLHAGQGDTDAALAALAEALRLAETGGLVRVFVDLRPGLDPLLSTLAQRDVAPAFIAAICSDTGWVGPQPAGAVGPQLAELLTFREADVLLLLCQRMTNREIAHALSISPDTVKEHTVHIYRKLGVHNRREAIARALALGIVRPRA
jgi:LuxR family maltose regulon positive regulatory protein